MNVRLSLSVCWATEISVTVDIFNKGILCDDTFGRKSNPFGHLVGPHR